MKKITFFVLIVAFSIINVYSQGWINAIKIESSNWLDETSLVTDNEGSVYAALKFRTDCIIADTLTINSTGPQDGIIIKFKDNSQSEIAFYKHLKSSTKVNISRMTVDKNNDCVYITGGFADTLIVDNDTVLGTGDGRLDGFLMKMKFNGYIDWVKRFCWGPNDERGEDINIDRDNNIVIAGIFKDSLYVGDELGTNTDSYYWNGYKNLFYAKYDTNGHKIFSNVIVCTNNTDFVNSIAIADNRYYFAGYFKNQITINGTNYLSAGGFDYLLFATDYYGNVQFVKNFGGSLDDKFNDLAIKDNFIYGVGSAASSSITVDGHTFGSHGGDDITVIKFDTSGTVQYVYINGNSLKDLASSVSTVDSGIIVSGEFTDDVDFGGTVYYGNGGDAFVFLMDTSGTIVKFAQAYGNNEDKGRRNSVDLYSLNNNRYVLGDFISDTLFIGNDSLINTYSNKAAFLAKYGCPKTNIDFVMLSDIACYGDSTASVIARPMVGVSPFTYQWNTGSASDTLNNLPSGWYTVTVTDANGCLQVDSVFINQPAQLSSVLEAYNESCTGNDGHIDLTVSGGTPQYYFNWSNGDTTEDINNLAAGNYSVTISDINGCTLVDSVKVNPFDSITVVSQITNESCNGNDGKIVLAANGGEAPYSYVWDNGDTVNVLENLSAGLYHVTVTDANGCSVVDSFAVLPYDTMNVVFQVENLSCAGNDGSVAAAVNGGNVPYLFVWSTGDTAAELHNIEAGWYVLTVTDASGCSVVDSVEVLPFANIQVAFTINNETCAGNDGVITSIVSGGTPPYSYAWSNGDTTAQADTLGAGVYTLTVTDHNGCQFIDSVNVLAYEPVTVFLDVHNEACSDNSGYINLVASGGLQPYSYIWNTGDTTQNLQNISAGWYYVTVYDANGCPAVDSAEVLMYTPLQVNVTAQSASCKDNDGSIDLFVTGGNQPYYYNWATGDTTQDIDSLGVGTYGYTITDATGCQYIDSVEITPIPAPEIQLSASGILCAGDSSANLSAEISGNNPPYTVVWYNSLPTDSADSNQVVATGTLIKNMPAGNYYVVVRDTLGCEYIDSITVTQPDSIKITFDITPENCKNTHTGSITTTVTGGASDIYFYNWSNGATTKSIEDLSTGTYILTVTDFNNCMVVDSAYVPLTEENCNIDLVIYNIITPNNDGQNDVWNIENVDSYNNVHVDIYNQWGNLVFSTDDYNEPWDATDNNGKKVAAGTYYYVIKLENGVTYSGYLTVMY